MTRTAGLLLMLASALVGVAAELTDIKVSDAATWAMFALAGALFIVGAGLTFLKPRRQAVSDKKPAGGRLWGGIHVTGGYGNSFKIGRIEAVHPVIMEDTHSNEFEVNEVIALPPTPEQMAERTKRGEPDDGV